MDDHLEKPIGAEPGPEPARKRPARRRRRYNGRRRPRTASGGAGKPGPAADLVKSDGAAVESLPAAPADLQPVQDPALQFAGPAEPPESAAQNQSPEPGPARQPESSVQAEFKAPAEPAEQPEPALPAGAGAPAPPALPAPAKKRRHRGGRRRRRRPAGSPAEPAGLPTGLGAAPEAQVSGTQAVLPAAPVPAEPAVEPAAARPAARPALPPRIQPSAAAPAGRSEPQASSRPEPETKVAPETLRALKIPGLDPAKAKKLLLDFIREQRELTGSNQAVIGLSGGLDSMVAAALIVEALGRSNVQMYYFMDNEKTDFHEKERARMVASRLGCQLEVRDVRPHLDLYFEQQPQVPVERRSQRLAWEISAWLSDAARQGSAMLAGSYNKTKRLLGLWPFYPLAASWNLLGDLYHNQLRDLARYLNIPAMILEQSQERRDLPLPGFSLNLADGLLYQMVDMKISLARLIDLGLPEEKISWLYGRLKATALQQKLPPYPDLTAAYVPKAWTGADM